MIRSHGQPSAEAASPGERAVQPAELDPAAAGPGGISHQELPGLVRNELRRLAEKLGEDVIGGHRHSRPDDGFRRTIDLAGICREGSEALRESLETWSRPPGPERVLLLVCLWREAWHLLDYSLAYRTLQVAETAATDFARDARERQADQAAPDWEVAALQAVGRAMCLITADATLFKLINLSSAEGLKAAAEQAVPVTGDIAAALTALDPPPFQADDGDPLAGGLDEIKAVASQNHDFYAALAQAANALIEFERWLETAPRLTSGRPAAPVAPAGLGREAGRGRHRCRC
jgi:hypothetical protein